MYNKTLYLNHMKTEAGIQQYIKDVLNFPDYYNKTLNSLYDMLTAMTGEAHITVECLNNPSPYIQYVMDVFKDAAEDNDDLEVDFV